jgi:hypothetical protein
MTLSSRERLNLLSAGLCLLGLLNLAGFLMHSTVLRGIALASTASPLPKVFSDVDGLEPFASEFTLHASTREGRTFSERITADLYQRLRGPYNRRNVYGAAIAFGPRLSRTLWEPVLCYGLQGPLRNEFHLPSDMLDVEIEVKTRTAGRKDTWFLNPHCAS